VFFVWDERWGVFRTPAWKSRVGSGVMDPLICASFM
jgi:hypothetical protein